MLLGNDLRYCNRDGPQCCSNEYFQYKAMDLRNDRLLNGLREQISENAVILDAISNGLRECKYTQVGGNCRSAAVTELSEL